MADINKQFSQDLSRFFSQKGFQGEPVQVINWESSPKSVSGQLVNSDRKLFDFTVTPQGFSFKRNNERTDAYVEGMILHWAGISPRCDSAAFIDGLLNFRMDRAKNCDGKTSQPCGDSCINENDRCNVKNPEVARVSQQVIDIAQSLESKYQPATETGFSKPVDQSHIAQAVEEHEKAIRTKPFENCAVINPKTGETIFAKSGKRDHVSFSDDEIEKMKGAIVTHNHPLDLYNLDIPANSKAALGSSFSPDDIATACTAEVGEMRACSIGHQHSIKPPPEGWNREFFEEKVIPSMVKRADETMTEMRHAVLLGKSPHEASAEFFHNVWTKVAADTGMEYKRERIPGNHAPEIERLRKPVKFRRNLRRFAAIGLLAIATYSSVMTYEREQPKKNNTLTK